MFKRFIGQSHQCREPHKRNGFSFKKFTAFQPIHLDTSFNLLRVALDLVHLCSSFHLLATSSWLSGNFSLKILVE